MLRVGGRLRWHFDDRHAERGHVHLGSGAAKRKALQESLDRLELIDAHMSHIRHGRRSHACGYRRESRASRVPAVSRLAEGEEVPFAVVEEGAELSGSLTRVVVGHDHHLALPFEAWDVDGFERDPATTQIFDDRLEVSDLESHLRGCA